MIVELFHNYFRCEQLSFRFHHKYFLVIINVAIFNFALIYALPVVAQSLTVSIITQPAAAKIFINGDYKGRSPFTFNLTTNVKDLFSFGRVEA